MLPRIIRAIGAIVLLAILLLPALAGAQTRGEIAQLERTRDSLERRELVLLERLERARADCDSLYALKGGCPIRPALALPPLPPGADGYARPRYSVAGGWIYLASALALPAANGYWKFDQDAGGYRDPWISRDKFEHAMLASSARNLARAGLDVSPAAATAITCAGSALYEVSQGWISGRDIAWSCGGAIVSHLLERGLRAIVGR